MQPGLPSRVDFERHAFIVQRDHRGLATATEWNAHASQADIARALCDNNLPDCAVIRIVECNVSEGWARDVTEDVARLIPAICDDARRDGWRVRACARALLLRFDLEERGEEETRDSDAELMQLGWNRERERCAIAGGRPIMNRPASPPTSRSFEMAATLLSGHNEAGLDLDNESLIDDWLRAAMYTDGQICLHRRAALDHARAEVQARDQTRLPANIADSMPTDAFADH